MGVVRLERVISFSCHDAKHQVKNMLCSSGPSSNSGGWLSSPFDSSGKIEAEFQLEKPSYIHFIDIGNSGSSSVEIFVRCSSSPTSEGYINLLPAVQLMNAVETRNGTNNTSVKMLTTDQLNPNTTNKKWDRVKVVCVQSYRKDKQFGLLFLRFSVKESVEKENATQTVHFDFDNVLKSPSPIKRRLSSPSRRLSKNGSVGMSRARTLVKAAQKKQLTRTSRLPKRALFQEDDTNSDLETDMMCFLTSLPSGSLQFSSLAIDASLEEYEHLRDRILYEGEREIFRKAFLSLLSQEDDSVLPMSDTNGIMNSQHFYSSTQRNGIKENGHHKETMTRPVEITNGHDISFDVGYNSLDASENSPSRDSSSGSRWTGSSVSPSVSMSKSTPEISPEKRPKRKKKYITMKDMVRSPVKQRRTSTPLVRGKIRQSNPITPHNDFIQSDGSVPSTSKEGIYVDCPICDEQFHKSEIESHAATCGDLAATMNLPANRDDDDDDEVTVISQHSFHGDQNSTVSCHSDGFVECPICGYMFKQAVVQNHTNMCIENCMA